MKEKRYKRSDKEANLLPRDLHRGLQACVQVVMIDEAVDLEPESISSSEKGNLKPCPYQCMIALRVKNYTNTIIHLARFR